MSYPDKFIASEAVSNAEVKSTLPLGKLRKLLLASTALIGVSLTSPVVAQTAFDSTESVNGGGGGTQASPLNVGSALTVGNTGTGTLTIENSGDVTNTTGYIGFAANSTGIVTVKDAGSLWASSADLYVGRVGTGTLSIENSGDVTNTVGRIGYGVGSIGTVTVNGTGSLWANSSSLLVGTSGTGTLSIENSGDVTNTTGVIGYSSGVTGTVTVNGAGSSWTNSADLSVGAGGTGVLTIENSGDVTNLGGIIGFNANSTGTVTVKDAGSLWANSTFLLVGRSGTGTLAIENDGDVTNLGSIIGFNANSTGTVTVKDAGSSWTNTGTLTVGQSGTGTLRIENDGDVTNTTGTIGNSIGSTGTVAVNGAGSSWTNTGTLTVGQSGTGTLAIENDGDVTNTNSIIGFNANSTGTVTVNGAGSSWTNTGTLAVGQSGTGTLNVSEGGVVNVGAGNALTIAVNNGSTGTLNIGAAAGSAAVGAGTISTAQDIAFGFGTGKIVFNHTESNHVFSHRITGAGTVDILAGQTTFSGNQAYTGDTAISGGKLLANGVIASSVLLTGGTLGGTGTIAGLTVGNGGTLAPGNSIGTLNIAGNATFNAGSIYTVEVDDAGNSDLLAATGTVTIDPGATVHVVPENGADNGSTYQDSTNYTIVTATGGVTGTFDAPTDGFTFLDASLSYDANNVFLTLDRNSTSFATVANTPNQIATSTAIGNAAPGVISNAISLLSDDAARNAFDQLSGEIYSTLQGTMLTNSLRTRDAVLARINNSHNDTSVGSSSHGHIKGDDANDIEQPASTGSFWMQGYGSWGHQSATTNNAGANSTSKGVVIGADGMTSSDWLFGLVVGYSHLDLSLASLASTAEVETYTVGAYGSTSTNGFDISVGADFSWNSIDTSRNVALPGFADSLRASYDGTTAQAYIDIAYRIEQDMGGITPFATLAYVDQRIDAFAETGGVAALSGLSTSTSTTFTTIGARFETQSENRTKYHATIGWRHAFDDVNPVSAVSFAGGNNFTITGMPIDEDAAIIEAGMSFEVDEQSHMNLTYKGQFADNARDQSFNAVFVMKF